VKGGLVEGCKAGSRSLPRCIIVQPAPGHVTRTDWAIAARRSLEACEAEQCTPQRPPAPVARVERREYVIDRQGLNIYAIIRLLAKLHAQQQRASTSWLPGNVGAGQVAGLVAHEPGVRIRTTADSGG
jgi:hypothetical protein